MSLKPIKNYKFRAILEKLQKVYMSKSGGGSSGGGGGSSGGCKGGYNTGKSNPCYCGTGYTFGGQ